MYAEGYETDNDDKEKIEYIFKVRGFPYRGMPFCFFSFDKYSISSLIF